LSEEARKRPGGEQSTIAARQAETDDLNEEAKSGPANSPNDKDVENDLCTWSSDEWQQSAGNEETDGEAMKTISTVAWS